MSRSINIGYFVERGGPATPIDVGAPYDLLGSQRRSLEFWSLPRLREIGITRLTELGVIDPIDFVGWDDIAELGREIALLQQHVRIIEYHPEVVARWIAHLVYCHSLLVLTTPVDCIPSFTIG